MSVTQGLCRTFPAEVFQGEHNLQSDTIKMALYDISADLDPSTITEYTTTDEVSGSGYTAGGVGVTISINQANQVELNIDAVTLQSADIEFRGALLYNATNANKGIGIIDTYKTQDVNGDLVFQFDRPQSFFVIQLNEILP